jgi:hypothetical protein
MDTPQWRFWREFRQESNRQHATLYPHNPSRPWNNNRHVGACPRSFAAYVYHIFAADADVSLEIHTRPGDNAECNRIFRHLRDQRREIEQRFGHALVWEERPDSHISFVRFPLNVAGLWDENGWASVHKRMLSEMSKLMTALDPAIATVTSPSY